MKNIKTEFFFIPAKINNQILALTFAIEQKVNVDSVMRHFASITCDTGLEGTEIHL